MVDRIWVLLLDLWFGDAQLDTLSQIIYFGAHRTCIWLYPIQPIKGIDSLKVYVENIFYSFHNICGSSRLVHDLCMKISDLDHKS